MPTENQKSVLKAKKTPLSSTQSHMRIGEIRDGVLVMKDGGLRMVLRTNSINFDLKSEREQTAILGAYQSFLNSLDFPIQILVKSRKLDIDNYLNMIEKKGQEQTNELIKKQTYEYIEYIQKLVELADIMKKDFYIIVPYDPASVASQGVIEKFFAQISPGDTASKLKLRLETFEKNSYQLKQRANTVKQGLGSCGLKVDELNTSELVELFYECYNPITAHEQKLERVSELDLEQ